MDNLKQQIHIYASLSRFFLGEEINQYKTNLHIDVIAPDKDWKQLGIYPPLFGLIGYFKS